MNIIDELTEYFRKFPGIGPRQASRFVYFLLQKDSEFLNGFSHKIQSLKKEVSVCRECFRNYIDKGQRHSDLCDICSSPNRDKSKLLIVASDTDFKNIEKSNTYDGLYFILGGTVPIFKKTLSSSTVRVNQLIKKVEKEQTTIKEIVIALNANPEGENTADMIRDSLKNIVSKNNIKISTLGRGLSTGAEIEYSDPETLKNAFRNRF